MKKWLWVVALALVPTWISAQAVSATRINFNNTCPGANPPAGTAWACLDVSGNLACKKSDGSSCAANPSPLTTKGDLYTFSTVNVRLPVGADTQVLTANSAQPSGLSWSPATAPTTPTLPTTGLSAEYRILATESAATLVDYSGNGNTAVGTVGTAPTIISGTGGLNCTGNGAVKLPAGLNSSQTLILVATYQSSSNANAFNALIFGNSAVGAQEVGILFNTNTLAGSYAQINGGSRVFTYPGTVGTGSVSRFIFQGTESIALVMANPDVFYINGQIQDFNSQPNTNSQGIQTSGQFQLCGVASGLGAGAQTYLTGKIWWAALWNRPLTAPEVSQAHNYASTLMAQTHALILDASGKNTSSVAQAVFDGDSITNGNAITTPWTSVISLNGSPNIANVGYGGKEMTANGPGSPATVDPLLTSVAPSAYDSVWLCTNDFNAGLATASQCYGATRDYCLARKARGAKCSVTTMLSRTGFDAIKNSFNTLLRQGWPTFADSLADEAGDTFIGADGASAGTCFVGDGTHPNQGCSNNNLAPIKQRDYNRLYGNRDWTSATTYAAAALAATATTAGAEAANTVTITFGATPANCQINNQIVITGTTPAGYSNGGGNPLSWNILTRSATQVTYYNNTTGLGAITVQGTGVCPEQQDADVFQILNFAGNYTLEPSVGYTGQSLCFKNINAGSPVLVPFGTETINGAASFTMTAGSKVPVCFQAQLVSAAAGGSNWVQTQ